MNWSLGLVIKFRGYWGDSDIALTLKIVPMTRFE
jgi:hypothetical protein